MTPATYIALARDLIILIALGLLIWLLISFGRDTIKVADMQIVQKQLDANSKTLARWAQEARDAQDQRTRDLDKVSAAIGAQRAPIVVLRDPSRPSALSAVPAPTPGQPAQTRGTDASAGINIRGEINRFELRTESAIAECRAGLAEWPQ